MTEPDRYLDSALVIRNLQEAERAHNLDAKGYLEKLAKAAVHCEKEGAHYNTLSTKYHLARAAYLLEAYKRTVLTHSETGQRSCARRYNHPDPISPERTGFKGWCTDVGIGYDAAWTSIKIARDPDPVTALGLFRETRKQRGQKYIQSQKAAAALVPAKSANSDPLRRFKIEWLRLSPENRQNALDWIMETDTSTWQEAAE